MEERLHSYRFLLREDYPGLIDIQARNVLSKLDPGERGDGYLSGEFSQDELEVMHDSAGIVVATVNGAIAGYLCLSTMEANHGFAIVRSMESCMRATTLGGKPVSDFNFVVAGPVCIDRPYRGQGCFEGLYGFALREMSPRFDLAVAFIGKANPRSLAAHAKVKMLPIAEFEHEGRLYDLVARLLP